MRRWSELDRRVLAGRVGGALAIVATLLTVAPDLIVSEGHPRGRAIVATLVGLTMGTTVLLLPWRRLPSYSLHVLPPLGAALVTMGAAIGPDYVARGTRWLYVLVVVFVACFFTTRRAVAGHFVVVALALVASVATRSDARDLAAAMLVSVPSIGLVAVVVVGLRERLQRDQRELARAAVRDPLTMLGNRRLLDERLEYELVRHGRTNRTISLLLLDLDRFKAVNEAHGYQAGDRLLKEVAAALRDTVREQDTIVRLGGDEFIVLAPETAADDAGALARRIEGALRRLSAAGSPLRASVGIATFPLDGVTSDELLRAADIGQRRSKLRHRDAAQTLAV
jgi:diguanylate cyclase (GGDEF)-like protein